jgi:hypothetical protein
MRSHRFLLIALAVLMLFSSACLCGLLDDEEEDTYNPDPSSEEWKMPAESEQSADAHGTARADIGFRPNPNGFSFENYGEDTENLTATELRRMFGDQVCSSIRNGKCTLTPPAKQWMKEMNNDMSGGHCEGMAALSLLMFTGQIPPQNFGGQTASELELDNTALQREIAYWWATQATSPTIDRVITGSPAQILDVLLNMNVRQETYTLGIYQPDGSDGHAITPFAVEDQGNGIYNVLVYDNNLPGEVRILTIDRHANTWSYEASINPSEESELYEGDADTQTLDLTPTSARLLPQQCPFCEEDSTSRHPNGVAAQLPVYNSIFIEGEGHVLIHDSEGRRLGYSNGKLYHEIPGAKSIQIKTGPGDDTPEPIYWLPQGMEVFVTLDGNNLSQESDSDLVLIGPGYSFGIEGIALAPGETDQAYFSPLDGFLSYTTDRSESPNIVIGIEQTEADFYFEIQGMEMKNGGEINVLLDVKTGDLVINAEKLTDTGNFTLYLSRYDDESEQEFYADDLELRAGSIVYIYYAEWKTDGSTLFIGVDLDGDDEIDEIYEVDDAG